MTEERTTAGAPGGAPSEDRVGRNIGVGCFTFLIGGVSGAMIAVLLGKIIGNFTRAPSCPDLPLCNWYVYAGYGALIGALSLPALAFWRLRQADRRSDAAGGGLSDRG